MQSCTKIALAIPIVKSRQNVDNATFATLYYILFLLSTIIFMIYTYNSHVSTTSRNIVRFVSIVFCNCLAILLTTSDTEVYTDTKLLNRIWTRSFYIAMLCNVMHCCYFICNTVTTFSALDCRLKLVGLSKECKNS